MLKFKKREKFIKADANEMRKLANSHRHVVSYERIKMKIIWKAKWCGKQRADFSKKIDPKIKERLEKEGFKVEKFYTLRGNSEGFSVTW